MKVKFQLGVGLVGCDRKEIVDLPDDSTEEQIEEDWKQWVWEYIDGYWEKVGDDRSPSTGQS